MKQAGFALVLGLVLSACGHSEPDAAGLDNQLEEDAIRTQVNSKVKEWGISLVNTDRDATLISVGKNDPKSAFCAYYPSYESVDAIKEGGELLTFFSIETDAEAYNRIKQQILGSGYTAITSKWTSKDLNMFRRDKDKRILTLYAGDASGLVNVTGSMSQLNICMTKAVS